MSEPLLHRTTERTIRALLEKLDEAAQHISELGCTCVDRSKGHQRPCTGYDLAKPYWQMTNRIRRRAGVQEKPRG